MNAHAHNLTRNLSVDFGCYAVPDAQSSDRLRLYLQIEGMYCAACALKIEQALTQHEGVEARVNYSTQRLSINWPASQGQALANELAQDIEALGYHAAPFDQDAKADQSREEEKRLLACLAVAGFATCTVMFFADALWFGSRTELKGASLDLMHWLMALVALPASIYAGRPFFVSALSVLKKGHTNMDVPISLAVILANGLSLYETINHGHYVYFDASVMLLFFLLVGRFLDVKARGRAREAAEGLLAMLEGTATILKDDEAVSVRIAALKPGDMLSVAVGEKIAADGRVIGGISDVDASLLTGESLPKAVAVGEAVYAGMINVSGPLRVVVSSPSDKSLLSEIVGLMERAEQGQSKYVRIADRVASVYAPAVHVLAALTFVGWMLIGHVDWENAMLKAMAVLIITCPCALGLAVPVVQVLASGELFRRGILIKSGKGLETLAQADTIVFDKTGTLTMGAPVWTNPAALTAADRRIAVSMARMSRHPLSQALSRAGFASCCTKALEVEVAEVPACGLEATRDGERIRLGKGSWLGVPDSGDDLMELWFCKGDGVRVRLTFEDRPRSDAQVVISALRAMGLRTVMLSGDREAVAQRLGRFLGLDEVRGALSPVDKVAYIEGLTRKGAKVAMVGDGLNDAPSLASAFVSLSPATAMDITQNAADIVYRGEALQPILTALGVARRTQSLVKQNFAVSIGYNFIAVPLAVAGLATPMIAAIGMSSSSLVVIGNAFRLKADRSLKS